MTWKTELRERVTTGAALGAHISLSDDEARQIDSVARLFPMAIPQYYLSLMDKSDPFCPIRRQSVPDIRETVVQPGEFEDPLGEEPDSPVPAITHRYPDRALFLVTHRCFMFCRHCNRRRKVGDARASLPLNDAAIDDGLRYLRAEKSIEDVLVSGGDPLILDTERLDWILSRLREIPHVRTVRIGTRAPVVMPSRITDHLVAVLKKASPLWLNTHFNHPKELTPESTSALAKLADAGIPLGNQTVLLRGVNDCPSIIRELCVTLVAHRVRPYYLFQCDLAQGIAHFRTRISTGLEIMESMIGHVRSYAVPTFAIDPPGGAGKVPILPNYLISQSDSAVVVRNYEGVITKYFESSAGPSECGSGCSCRGNSEQGQRHRDAGQSVAAMLDRSGPVSLVPQGNARELRRSKRSSD
ncbi:MAG: KamA family radical SAM protein [Deltaproteobacteria bacterium]|nr:KamA family radical SAM protein [Deltaproteobacteria bacterium]MBN2673618.1 KamA family radical SAM protein [Deltaproteobacteria bacterium]